MTMQSIRRSSNLVPMSVPSHDVVEIFTQRWMHLLTGTEEAGQVRGRVGQGVEREVWCHSGQDDQGDRRQEHGRL